MTTARVSFKHKLNNTIFLNNTLCDPFPSHILLATPLSSTSFTCVFTVNKLMFDFQIL